MMDIFKRHYEGVWRLTHHHAMDIPERLHDNYLGDRTSFVKADKQSPETIPDIYK